VRLAGCRVEIQRFLDLTGEYLNESPKATGGDEYLPVENSFGADLQNLQRGDLNPLFPKGKKKLHTPKKEKETVEWRPQFSGALHKTHQDKFSTERGQ